MAGYTRQSVADIVNGSNITAPPLNAEFNQLASAFDPATGHSHDGSSGNSPKIDLTTSITGYLPAIHGGIGGKNNTQATANPTTTDDFNDGYAPGSIWLNVSTGRAFICITNTVNNAVWTEAMGITPNNRVTPEVSNTVDLGSSTYQFKDIYIDGTGYIDAVSGDTLTLTSNASVGGNLTLTGNLVGSGNITNTGTGYFGGNLTANADFAVTGTLNANGDVNFGNAQTDTVTFISRVDSSIVPATDGTYNLGSTGNEWQNLYIDGTAEIDQLNADSVDIDSGTIDNTVIGGTTPVAGSFSTLSANSNASVTGNLTVDGSVTLGNASADNLTVNATLSTSLIPTTDNAVDLGSVSNEWRNLYIDGVATVDSLTADTVNIDGGTIDNTVIGGATPVAGSFTTLSTSGQATLATVDINGGAIDNTTVGATTPSTGAFTTLSASSGINGDLTGNVTGNVSGNITGNITGDVTGDLTGNVTASTGSSTFNDVVVNGTLDVTGTTIANVTDPTSAQDAATKNYVDTNDALKVTKAGDTMTGNLTMSGGAKVTGLPAPTVSSDAANKGYVDQEISAVIDSAPGALDTLNELAAALGDDPNYATTITNALATKLPLAGGTMTGSIAMGANAITGMADPTNAQDAATKNYVDTNDALKLNLTGGTMSGAIAMGSSKITGLGTPTAGTDATTKTYVDTQRDTRLATAGGTMTGNITLGTNKITTTANPTADDDLARKGYVDNILQSATAASASAAAAATSETNAATSETNASTSAQLAEDWAIKTSGTVDGTNYSAKYWATQADVGTVATNISNINTVAGIDANVTTVAGIDTDVTTVAGISSDVTTVSGINANVTTVAGISGNVTTVAGVSTNVTTVATDIANVNTVATNIADINTVANDIANVITAANDLNEAVSEIDTVANNIANVNTVGNDITDVNTVATSIANVNTAATNIANVNTVAGINSDVTTVAGIAADVTTAATNVVDFNNRYLGPQATAPTVDPNGSALDLGDLYYDTSTNVMKVYGSAGWTTAASAVNGTADRFKYTATASQTTFSGADDSGNTLGYDSGYLDVFLNGVKLVNGTDFTATSGSSIVLTSGAAANDILEIVAYGTFELANFNIDAANDVSKVGITNGQFLQWNASAGQFEPASVATDLSGDTTPQLGGNLDLNGNNITGTGNIDITGSLDTTGNIQVGTSGSLNVNVGTNAVTFNRDAASFIDNPVGASSAIQMRLGSAYTPAMILGQTEVVLNENSNDVDFRVESNANSDMFFLDAGNNKIGIRENTPAHTLHISGQGSQIGFGSVDASDGGPHGLAFYDDSTGGAGVGMHLFYRTGSEQISFENGGQVPMVTISKDGSATFNEAGLGTGDFRVESDSQSHQFWVDASANRTVFGGSASNQGDIQYNCDEIWHISPTTTINYATDGNTDSTPNFQVVVDDDGTTKGRMRFYGYTGSMQELMQIQSDIGSTAGGTTGKGVGFGHAGVFFDRGWGNRPSLTVMSTSSTGQTTQDDIRLHGTNSTWSAYPDASGADFSTGIYMDGSVTQSSDRRFKTNIESITNALDIVQSMDGKRFQTLTRNGALETSRSEADGFKYGFIGQELQSAGVNEIYKYHADEDDGTDGYNKAYAVDYASVTALLVNAIKEQQTIIDDLKSRVEALEAN